MPNEDSGITDEVTLEEIGFEKEPFFQSARTKTFLGGLVLLGLMLFSDRLGLNIPIETLKVIAFSATTLIIGFIASRSYRNTAT